MSKSADMPGQLEPDHVLSAVRIESTLYASESEAELKMLQAIHAQDTKAFVRASEGYSNDHGDQALPITIVSHHSSLNARVKQPDKIVSSLHAGDDFDGRPWSVLHGALDSVRSQMARDDQDADALNASFDIVKATSRVGCRLDFSVPGTTFLVTPIYDMVNDPRHEAVYSDVIRQAKPIDDIDEKSTYFYNAVMYGNIPMIDFALDHGFPGDLKESGNATNWGLELVRSRKVSHSGDAEVLEIMKKLHSSGVDVLGRSRYGVSAADMAYELSMGETATFLGDLSARAQAEKHEDAFGAFEVGGEDAALSAFPTL